MRIDYQESVQMQIYRAAPNLETGRSRFRSTTPIDKRHDETAQDEYAEKKRDDSKVNQYVSASSVLSVNLMVWPGRMRTANGRARSERRSQKRSNKSTRSQPQPFHGYYFKVLKGQGPAAPMGQMDFVVEGAMIGGFALAAVPAQYRVTGVQSFIVRPDGIVYQKDLGTETLKAFESMDLYNPDKTWKPTDDEWPEEEEEAPTE